MRKNAKGTCRTNFTGPLFKPCEFGEWGGFRKGFCNQKVVVCRNNLCNSSWDAMVSNGRKTNAFFLLFGVQQFVCNIFVPRDVPNVFQAWSPQQVLQSNPLPNSPPPQTPENPDNQPLLRTPETCKKESRRRERHETRETRRAKQVLVDGGGVLSGSVFFWNQLGPKKSDCQNGSQPLQALLNPSHISA